MRWPLFAEIEVFEFSILGGGVVCSADRVLGLISVRRVWRLRGWESGGPYEAME